MRRERRRGVRSDGGRRRGMRGGGVRCLVLAKRSDLGKERCEHSGARAETEQLSGWGYKSSYHVSAQEAEALRRRHEAPRREVPGTLSFRSWILWFGSLRATSSSNRACSTRARDHQDTLRTGEMQRVHSRQLPRLPCVRVP
eukprot:scaffold117936_cov63-Phaeocystis_antarctica.AAC.14